MCGKKCTGKILPSLLYFLSLFVLCTFLCASYTLPLFYRYSLHYGIYWHYIYAKKKSFPAYWQLLYTGATPYPELRTGEVKARILQGLRLPQTEYVSDQLYQLMLTSWMTDPSERPDFNYIIENLAALLEEQVTK